MPILNWTTLKLVNTTLAGVQNDMSLTELADGKILAVWSDKGGATPVVRSQMFNADGTVSGAETTFASNGYTETDTAGLVNGGFAIVMRAPSATAGDTGDLAIRLVKADGTIVNSVITAANTQLAPEIKALSGGGFAVVYEGSVTVGGQLSFAAKLRIFDANGVSSAEIAVGSSQGTNGSLNGADRDVSVEQLANGNIVVGYQGAGGLAAYRLYSAAGGALLAEQAASAAIVGEVALTAHGAGFAMAWTGLFGNTTVMARVFDANGTPAGAAFDVSGSNSPGGIELVSLGGSKLMAAWIGTLGSGQVSARIYDTATGTAEPEFQIAAPGSAAFNGAMNANLSLEVMNDGRVAVSWSTAGSGDIVMQIVDPRNGTVNATAAGDKVYGHDLVNDTMNGGNGNDEMHGLGGHDLIRGEAGNDTINGGAGNDTIDGGTEADVMDGGAGIDTLDVSSFAGLFNLDMNSGGTNFAGETALNFEHVTAGDGANIIIGTAAANIINTNGGNDEIRGGGGNDTINAGAGNDTVFGGDGYDIIDGGDGIDWLDLSALGQIQILNLNTGSTSGAGDFFNFENAILTNGNDGVTGTDAANLVHLNAGDDSTDMLGGNDTVYAGDGNDYIAADDGDDWVDASSGDDVVYGGAGGDTVYGGSGNDAIFGDHGVNFLYGGHGADSITGGGDTDVMFVDSSDVYYWGGSGLDYIVWQDVSVAANVDMNAHQAEYFYGYTGDNSANGQDAGARVELHGGDGNDTLTGANGFGSILLGGNGDDRLIGRNGIDHFAGGAGQDTFVFGIAENVNYIYDFERGTDKIDLTALADLEEGGGIHSIADLAVNAAYSAAGWYGYSWASNDGGGTIWVQTGAQGSLTAPEFLFA